MVQGIETLESRKIRWEIHNQAIVNIENYLIDKYHQGILIPRGSRTEKNWAFTYHLETPVRVFQEILCSTLAIEYCKGQFVTEVTRYLPTNLDYRTPHWTIYAYPNNYYPDIILGAEDVDSVTFHLRHRRDYVWKPRR